MPFYDDFSNDLLNDDQLKFKTASFLQADESGTVTVQLWYSSNPLRILVVYSDYWQSKWEKLLNLERRIVQKWGKSFEIGPYQLKVLWFHNFQWHFKDLCSDFKGYSGNNSPSKYCNSSFLVQTLGGNYLHDRRPPRLPITGSRN